MGQYLPERQDKPSIIQVLSTELKEKRRIANDPDDLLANRERLRKRNEVEPLIPNPYVHDVSKKKIIEQLKDDFLDQRERYRKQMQEEFMKKKSLQVAIKQQNYFLQFNGQNNANLMAFNDDYNGQILTSEGVYEDNHVYIN